jgi:hypothetical protein
MKCTCKDLLTNAPQYDPACPYIRSHLHVLFMEQKEIALYRVKEHLLLYGTGEPSPFHGEIRA